MDEKQRLQEAEAAQMAAVDSVPSPPAYTEVKVSVETIEALTVAPQLPSWIKRLPITLPLAHFMLSVPLALFFSRSLGGAVFFCSAVSFWLVATATAGIARATRHDVRLQKAGVRYLCGAGALMIIWPLLVVMILGPSHLARCHRMRHHHHHNKHHHQHGRPFHLHHDAPVAHPVHTVGAVSTKGDRVLVAAVGQKLAELKAMFPKLEATRVRVVVSSEGVKSLFEEDLARLKHAAAPIADKVAS